MIICNNFPKELSHSTKEIEPMDCVDSQNTPVPSETNFDTSFERKVMKQILIAICENYFFNWKTIMFYFTARTN